MNQNSSIRMHENQIQTKIAETTEKIEELQPKKS